MLTHGSFRLLCVAKPATTHFSAQRSAVANLFIDHIVNAIGHGWTYVLPALAGICLVYIPVIWLAIWIGPRCHAE
jgi:hypothetical protein